MMLPALGTHQYKLIRNQSVKIMELACPNCKTPINPENINIASDLAKCSRCNTIHKASALIPDRSNKKMVKPPSGTKMTVKKGFDDSIELFYPKKGFTAAIIPKLIFIVFWLGFISIWTWMSLGTSVYFSMLSIPFWLVGFGMLYGLVFSVSESQVLKISRTVLTLERIRPFSTKKFEAPVYDIQSIRMQASNNNSLTNISNAKVAFKTQKFSGTSGEKMPAIISGVKTEYFFESATTAEQEWVTSTLDGIIKKINA